MIRQEVIRSLSMDELAMLLYALNNLWPPRFDIEVNANILSAYKKDSLIWGLVQCKPHVKEEFISIYDSMMAKLNGLTPTTEELLVADIPKVPEQLEFAYDG